MASTHLQQLADLLRKSDRVFGRFGEIARRTGQLNIRCVVRPPECDRVNVIDVEPAPAGQLQFCVAIDAPTALARQKPINIGLGIIAPNPSLPGAAALRGGDHTHFAFGTPLPRPSCFGYPLPVPLAVFFDHRGSIGQIPFAFPGLRFGWIALSETLLKLRVPFRVPRAPLLDVARVTRATGIALGPKRLRALFDAALLADLHGNQKK